MDETTVIEPPAGAASKSLNMRVLLAFFAIYVLWGTSFLAIRIAVLEVPPLFAAGTRFFVAGVVLYGFMRLRGRTSPTRSQWRSLALLALLMFVAEYGPLFWAEKYVPSGIASVLEATLPLITMAIETWVFRRQRFHWPLLAAILLGFCGVGVMLFRNGEQQFGWLPCVAILAGATTWSLGSVFNRSLDLPESRPLTSGAAMALGGAMLLVLSAVFGELSPLPHVSMRAALAILYLIAFPSLLGFTAFVWLLARMPATRVASHAYVNPVVAVALGYFVAGETISLRTLIGTALVLASVILILGKEKAAI
ncbi:MAG TPA: EamA family transporter [Bryobacteraceae bacterium]|jgi:drug/metabolite transporter (DMT)-like permease|nr:EamA family transporter [Bryobacteraceae bacterium]